MRYLIILIFLFGCTSEKKLFKAEARLAQAGRLSAICSERFPVIPDTTYLKDSVVIMDTVLSSEYITDTVHLNDTLYIAKYKPVTIVKEVIKTKVETVVDKAKEKSLERSVASLSAKIDTLEAESTKYKGKAKARLNWLILIAVAISAKLLEKPIKRIIQWHSLKIPKL